MIGEVLLALRLFLAASLFVFLGWVVWVFWRELQTNIEIISSRRHPPLALIVETLDTEAKQIFTSEDSEITIGRDPACELCLEDDNISAHHARFSFHHSQWWLEDLRSTNGTLLNDEPLNTATVVILGDVIVCGNIRLTLARIDTNLEDLVKSAMDKTGE